MTGYSDPALASETHRVQASVLHKPFTPNTLLGHVRDALRAQSSMSLEAMPRVRA
jgi:hypothetical protein